MACFKSPKGGAVRPWDVEVLLSSTESESVVHSRRAIASTHRRLSAAPLSPRELSSSRRRGRASSQTRPCPWLSIPRSWPATSTDARQLPTQPTFMFHGKQSKWPQHPNPCRPPTIRDGCITWRRRYQSDMCPRVENQVIFCASFPAHPISPPVPWAIIPRNF